MWTKCKKKRMNNTPSPPDDDDGTVLFDLFIRAGLESGTLAMPGSTGSTGNHVGVASGRCGHHFFCRTGSAARPPELDLDAHKYKQKPQKKKVHYLSHYPRMTAHYRVSSQCRKQLKDVSDIDNSV